MGKYAKVSSKGQITLSADIRKQLNIEPGTLISIVKEGEGVYLSPVKDDLARLKGAVKVKAPQNFKKARHQAMEEAVNEKCKNY